MSGRVSITITGDIEEVEAIALQIKSNLWQEVVWESSQPNCGDQQAKVRMVVRSKLLPLDNPKGLMQGVSIGKNLS